MASLQSASLSKLEEGEQERLRLRDLDKKTDDSFSVSDDAVSLSTSLESHSIVSASSKQNCRRFCPWLSLRNVSHFLIVSMLVMAVLGPIYAYRTVRNSQESELDREFLALSTTLQDSFGTKLSGSFGALAGLCTYATSYAQQRPGSNWPHVTLDDFHLHARRALSLAQSFSLSMSANIQTPEERLKYENETIPANLGWLNQARRYSAMNQGDRKLSEDDVSNTTDQENLTLPDDGTSTGTPFEMIAGVFNKIYAINPATGRGVPDPFPAPWTPITQTYPLLGAQSMNFNLRATLIDKDAIDACLASKKSVIGLSQRTTIDVIKQFYTALLRESTGDPTIVYDGQPTFSLYYPVFEDFSQNENRTVVAIMAAGIYWPTLFYGSLPSNVPPLHVVVSNTCGVTFTLEVQGNDVKLLALEDVHDPEYGRDMVLSESVADILRFSAFETTVSNWASLDQDFCPHTFSVHGTKELHDMHITPLPYVVAALTSFFFVIAAAILLSYDYVTYRRLRRIEKVERDNGGLVSSLFPKQVLERMLQRKRGETETRNYTINDKPTSSTQGKDVFGYFPALQQLAIMLSGHPPIADLFPRCTVCFSFIHGFHEWSQTKEPEDVIRLLEEVFQSMDRCVKAHRVFKVETIHHTFLTVTGLPDKDPKHAVRQAEFARSCIASTNQLFEAKGLTGQLQLMIGMYSGQVTAGVLEGDRARFQLFGDTVNMASRMASTSKPGCIQISDSTFQLLKSARRELWTLPREDHVHAKGKGNVVTHWLVGTNSDKRSVASQKK